MSIFCFIPPHMLRSIAKNGSKQQRESALACLSSDNTIRSFRSARMLESVRGAEVVTDKEKKIEVYDCAGKQALPGKRLNSARTKDRAAKEAVAGLNDTYDFFDKFFNRNSLDDEGMPLKACVHFGRKYENAFWDGQYMVFGDGDGHFFNRFTSSLDVIAHELGHGITEDESKLAYLFQPGAINESLSDVFGAMVKQCKLGQEAGEADWIIGAELLSKHVYGDGLRSMKAPGTAFDDPVLGKDPQPAHMKDFVNTYEDNGGVHINSGIPNRAFYLAAVNIGGYSWENAGRIWYESLRDSKMLVNIGFKRFARLTAATAEKLYGTGYTEHEAVKEAWLQVGIKI